MRGGNFRGGRGRPRGGGWVNSRRDQDPLNIPKSGYYYEHDDREGDAAVAHTETKDIDKWTHDLYKENQENTAKAGSTEAINNQNAATETNQSVPTERADEAADEERPSRRRRFEETEAKDQLEEDNETKEHGSPISEEHLV